MYEITLWNLIAPIQRLTVQLNNARSFMLSNNQSERKDPSYKWKHVQQSDSLKQIPPTPFWREE